MSKFAHTLFNLFLEMILILSSEESEKSTNVVIDFLKKKKANFYRLNGDDLISNKIFINFFLSPDKKKWEFEIIDGQIKIYSSKIKAVWFRRNFSSNSFDFLSDNKFSKLNNFMTQEIISIYKLIEYSLNDAFWLNSILKSHNPKLKFLEAATKVGFNVPFSCVTNNYEFLSKINKKLITKPTTEAFLYEYDSEFKFGIAVERIENMPNLEYFFPSFCQEEIDIEYEVRIFYLLGETFSIMMANKSEKSVNVDIRDSYGQFRSSKYELPNNVHDKIVNFMELIGVNCGSIDLAKDIHGKYWFIEMNPVGQFDNVSIIGNYNLESKIANILHEKSI